MLKNADYIITSEVERLTFRPIDYFFEGPINKNLNVLPTWLKNNSSNKNGRYRLICIGDVVSSNIFDNKILSNHVDMAIVDGKTKGRQYNKNLKEEFKETFDLKFEIKNSKGMISAEAIKLIKSSLKSRKKTLFLIIGEEDLLVVPLILYSKLDSFIIYGQASKTCNDQIIHDGLVVVKVTKGRKKELKKILKDFSIRKRKI